MADQGYGSGGRQGGDRYSGPERRVGINYNYTGPERRHDEFEQRQREQQGKYGQTGGMGMRPNTTERGHFGSGGDSGSMGGGTSGTHTGDSGRMGSGSAESDRGGRVGPERPYDEDVEDQ